MSIFSSIGSALSRGYQAVKSAVSSLFTSGTGYNPLTANAFTSIPTASASTKNPVTGISKTGGTTYYNNYVPPAYDNKGNVIPNSVSSNYSAINSGGGVGSAPYGPQLPVKIGAGTQKVSSSTGLTSGVQDFFYNPEPVTLSAQTLGASDGGSTGSLSSPGTQPIQLTTSPSNVSVGQTDSTRLASGFSGYRKYNATTRQWEDVAAPVEEKQPTLDEKLKERMDILNKYVGIKPDVYEDPQVIQARNEVNRIKQELRAPTDELNAVIAKQNQDLLQLRQTGAKEGVTEAVYGQQQNAINYNAAIRALPLQANIARIQGNLELAQDYLKEEMNIKQSQIDRQYEYNKTRFASISNFLDKEDERTYKEITTANDRAYQEQRDLVKIQGELLQNAVPQGAPMSIQNSIRNATSIPEAIMAAGRYATLGDNQIVKLDDGSTVIVDRNTGTIVSNLGGTKTVPSVTGLTPEQSKDPFIQKMAKTAGGKPITDTFAQQLNKGLTVLGQIGVLQTNIKDMKTGPILGAFRGSNPWDANAQTIKAQLNAVVPNLARGVYGEVGVLTDNDIKNYSKTLPTLKSTDDTRNAVLGITVDLIGKSLKRNLEVNAANGKDVSGFIDIYTEMLSTRDSIFSQIPGYKGSGSETSQVSPEVQSLREKYNY